MEANGTIDIDGLVTRAGEQETMRRLHAFYRPSGIEIRTLGQFDVRTSQPCDDPGSKAQQRPFALLKALVARGGHSVSANQLWECLWPDSEGDLGARNLTITLHRLRHLLGTNAAILHHDAKLTVNPRLCWIDVWEFERLVNDNLHRPMHGGDDKTWEARLRAALELYQGHFLALEAEEAWMLEPRLRWKTKFERVVTALTTHLEGESRFAEAIDLCLQALEIDPLDELLYRRLMSCYLQQGELSAAMRAHARCREALEKGLGAQPSEETERLYRLATGCDSAGNRRPAVGTLLTLAPSLQSTVRVAVR